jgi:hypothetical protein
MKITAILSLALALTTVTAKVSVRGSKGNDSFLETIDRTRRLMSDNGKNSVNSGDNGGCTVSEDYDPLCAICDQCNKIRPSFLTFQYKAAGLNSEYQGEKFASCREGAYPEITNIKAYARKDPTQIYYDGPISDGDVFTIAAPEGGKFEAETDFEITDWAGGSCFIHTSCSVPLVQGDQIGPLIVMVGTGCEEPATVAPTPPPTSPPTEPPTAAPKCIMTPKTNYDCGEDITVTFDFAYPESIEADKGALVDDWIGIYPCVADGDAVPYLHSESWLWTCAEFGANFKSCNEVALSAGSVTFKSPMAAYNDNGPHTWPIAPYHTIADDLTSPINTCFKAVLLRFDGPSVPPYVKICESPEFTISATSTAECQVRPNSPAAPILEN